VKGKTINSNKLQVLISNESISIINKLTHKKMKSAFVDHAIKCAFQNSKPNEKEIFFGTSLGER
jgi:hypothetical protein